jgi:acetylornithine deacetylase/succinyl-diaminopimelate desuccinylase-like protein
VDLYFVAAEESTSEDLVYYLHNHEKFKNLGDEIELVVCLDSGCGNYEQLWLTTSLRGILGGKLTVSILSEGQHSGSASGIVPDTFR